MRILCYILVVLFVTTSAVGQQINPVPDYIFRNSMSVGRNAPTDTSAYFSIGPRFGATRGFMPPMVVDTAAVTGTKRNGLLIYSIQRNSFLYWDSTGSRWSRIAANLDTLLLSTRAWRQKGDDSLAARINTRTDTLLIATRAWRQKGDDSLAARIASAADTNTLSTRAWRQKGIDSLASVRIGGSGVTGYIPKFTAARTLDSSQIFQSGGRIGIGTVSAPVTKLQVEAGGGRILWVTDSLIHTTSANTNITVENHFQNASGVASIDLRTARFGTDGTFGLSRIGGVRSGNGTSDLALSTSASADNPTERMRITSDGNVGVGTSSPSPYAGSNRVLQIDGGSVASELRLTNNTSGAGGGNGAVLQLSGNDLYIWNVENSFFSFGTNNTERMRIFSNGRIAVNSVTDAGYQFDVAGSIRGTSDAYFATGSGSAKLGVGTTTPVGWVSVIRSGANTSTTNSGFWVSHDASGTASDGLGIGTNGSASYKWLQSFNGALSINAAGNNVGIGNTAPSEALHVTGRIRATTIDSSASPINMLWSTPTGVISKTAPPAFMVSSNATAATSWNFARDVTNSGNISRVTRTHDNAGDTTITFHIAVYIATASFTTGSWVEVATLPTGYRPNEVVYGSLPDFVSGDVYEAQNGTDFAADAEYTGATVFRVLKDGKVQVRVATVTSSVTLSGTNNVLFPISFTFTVRPISV